METLLDKIASKITVNGPKHRGDKMPISRPFSINEVDIPDNMRCKEYNIEVSNGIAVSGLFIEYVTQEAFNGADLNDFLEEIKRLIHLIGTRYDLEKFGARVNVRDNYSTVFADAAFQYDYDTGNVSVDIIEGPSDGIFDEDDYLDEAVNPLKKAANFHKKKKKGLPYNYKPNAGNVEANNAFFNHINTPNTSFSTNPCGPMAGAMGESVKLDFDKSDFNLRDALNAIDSQLEKPCLLDMYLASNLDDADKLELANMITSDEFDINAIYDFLNCRYLNEDWVDFDSINDIEDLKVYLQQEVGDPLNDVKAITFSNLRYGEDLSNFTDVDIYRAAKLAGFKVVPIPKEYSYDGSDDDYLIYKNDNDYHNYIYYFKQEINSESKDDDWFLVNVDGLEGIEDGDKKLRMTANTVAYLKQEAERYKCKLIRLQEESWTHNTYAADFLGKKKDLVNFLKNLLMLSDKECGDFLEDADLLTDEEAKRYLRR